MKTPAKRNITLIVLMFIIPVCLFADNWFTLSHEILGTCYSVFWDPSSSGAGETPTELSEVDVTNKSEVFATLGIIYTGSKRVDIAIGFSPLYLFDYTNQVFDTSETCPYSMTILSPGTNTVFSESAPRETVSETVNLQTITFQKVFLIHNGATNTLGIANNSGRAIADFKMILDTDAAMAGTYMGFLKCYITIGN